MQNIGRIVENTAQTVPAKIAHNCEPVNFGMLLNGEADVSQRGTGPHGIDACHHRLICYIHQALGLHRHIARLYMRL